MRLIRMACGAAVIAAAMLLTSDVLAGGNSGSGGGGAPPAGTIYAHAYSDVVPPGGGVLTMDGNGANRTVLPQLWNEAPPALTWRPSRALHGGRRWILGIDTVPGETFRGGKRLDVFAVRDDGALRVRLTSGPTMQYGGYVDWAPDEDASGATISGLARRWTGPTSADTVVEWGLYTAHLAFDGAGNVVGLDAEPTFAVFLGTRTVGSPDWPDVATYCWSPDMTRLVADSYPGHPEAQIRVIDVASGDVFPLGPGASPDWSPDGSRIASARFVKGSKPKNDAHVIETVAPDGTQRTTVLSVKYSLNRTTLQTVAWPRWSPDGAHLAYRYTIGQGASSTYYVYRVASNGSGSTNLTPDVTRVSVGTGGIALVSWR